MKDAFEFLPARSTSDNFRQKVIYNGEYYGDIYKLGPYWESKEFPHIAKGRLKKTRKNKLAIAKMLVGRAEPRKLSNRGNVRISMRVLEDFMWPGLVERIDAVKLRREKLYGYCDIDYPVTPEEIYLATKWQYLA